MNFIALHTPLHSTLIGLFMPLPCIENGAKKCQCKSKRTGLPCLNPAAFGQKACRMHGAHKNISRLTGINHPNFKNGEQTLQAKANRSNKSLMFLMLEELGHHIEMFHPKANRTRGRKPKMYKKLDLNEPDELAKAIELSLPKD